MRRRNFFMLVGGAAVGVAGGWPLSGRAQADRARVIGVIMPLSSHDAEVQRRLAAFREALEDSGWKVDRNLRIEYRWGAGDNDRDRRNVAELIGLNPDVILATGSPTLEPLLRATRTVPIVFAQVADPVGAGLVASLSRPGGNATGFTTADYNAAGKWLELLKEVAPAIKRVALLRDSKTGAGIGQWGASEAFAGSFGFELTPINVSTPDEIERSIDAFAKDADAAAGMIVTNSGPSIVHRELVIALAAGHRLPAIYPQRLFATSGGLISYGSDAIDSYRRAASYVDRILKGAKPTDLPVQNPTKFELVINLKTAKTLGLTIPQTLFTRADELIE